MTAPLYFLATDTPLAQVFNEQRGDPFAETHWWWAARGFGCVVENHRGACSVSEIATSGPDGQRGLLLCVWPKGTDAPPLGYWPHEQTWQQIRQDIWVGWNERPSPDDLCNGDPWSVDGDAMALGDGNFWLIPTVRRHQQMALPSNLGHDLEGNLTRTIKPQFADLWRESGEWFDKLWKVQLEGESVAMPLDEAMAYAIAVLQLRYRLPIVLADALGIIDDTNLRAIIGQSIGWPLVIERIKQLAAQHEGDDVEKKSPE